MALGYAANAFQPKAIDTGERKRGAQPESEGF